VIVLKKIFMEPFCRRCNPQAPEYYKDDEKPVLGRPINAKHIWGDECPVCEEPWEPCLYERTLSKKEKLEEEMINDAILEYEADLDAEERALRAEEETREEERLEQEFLDSHDQKEKEEG